MKIYNTLTKKKEEFKPIKPNQVGMYVCGLTVYMPMHLGHIKTYIGFDVIKKYFEYRGYKVFYVRNFTDVGSIVGDADQGEDKIVLKAKEMSVHPLELVDMNIKASWDNLDALHCDRPNISPRATGHIVDIIEAVQTMIDKGAAYELNGDVYLDVTKIKNYGVLSGNTLENLNAGARIEVKDGKHSPYDFTIWKKAQNNSALRWHSPWGDGYPGWHIECTVMSTKYLGDQFDIHGGGLDLRFPHHENEIAQSFALGKPMPANYWLHTGTLLAEDGQKMSKSKGNFITVDDAFKMYGARALRWFFVNAKYNAPIKFGADVIKASNQGLERIDNFVFNLKENAGGSHNASITRKLEELKVSFIREMDDDFNIPNAVACLFEFIKDVNTDIINHNYDEANKQEILAYLGKLDTIFSCLNLNDEQKDDREEKVKALINERNKYRQEKNFAKADEIKQQILAMNVEIFDTKEGTTFKLK